MIEKEVKVLLGEDEFKRVLDYFDWEFPFEQINYYYGVDKAIEDDITIRIREKNGYKLQVKVPKQIEGSLHIKEEYEESVDNVYSVIEKSRLEKLTGYKFDTDKKLLGKLVTVRRLSKTYPNVEIALDENYYLGYKDYEIEIEYLGDYPSKVVQTLKKLNINVEVKAIGKNRRFNEKLRELGLWGDNVLHRSI